MFARFLNSPSSNARQRRWRLRASTWLTLIAFLLSQFGYLIPFNVAVADSAPSGKGCCCGPQKASCGCCCHPKSPPKSTAKSCCAKKKVQPSAPQEPNDSGPSLTCSCGGVPTVGLLVSAQPKIVPPPI